MGASQSTAVGSIFGFGTEAQTILGLSTVAQTGILGLSMATTVIGGVVVIGLLSYGIYKYTRNDGDQIYQTSSQTPLNHQQLHPNYDGPQIPSWQRISMSQQQFNNLVELSQSRYDQNVKKFTCPISMQIMRKPCKMKCCMKTERTDKWAEQNLLRNEIKKIGRCLLCRSNANLDFIQFDEDVYQSILGFRQRLVKTYKTLPTGQKRKWKDLIDKEFGQGYKQEHLQNFIFG